jgi:predicted GNAT family acetyltransferase
VNQLERCWGFELGLEMAFSERVEDVGDGITAVLDTRIPLVWDANYLLAEAEEVTAQQLAAKADEVLGGLGMEHRSAGTRDPATSDRVAAGLEKLGWEREDSLHMVLRREPDRPADAEVEQVSLDDVRHINEAIIEAEDWGSREVAEQIHSRNRRIGGEWSDRWFAARNDGQIASCCRLLQREGIGQVEDVATLEGARGHGLARAVVLEAARTSVDDGDELTFLSALAGDWPRELYTRLGFDAVGEVSYARRKPD